MVNVSGLRTESDKDRLRTNRRKNYIAKVEVCVYHNKKPRRTKSRAELLTDKTLNASSADDCKKYTKLEDIDNNNSSDSETSSHQAKKYYLKPDSSAYRVGENVSIFDGMFRSEQYFEIGTGVKDQPEGFKIPFESDRNVNVESNFMFRPLLTLFDHIKTQNGDKKLINLDYYRLYTPTNTKSPSEIDNEVPKGVNTEKNKKNASVETIHCQQRRKFSFLTKCRSDLSKAVDDVSIVSQKTVTILENDYLNDIRQQNMPSSTSITTKDTKNTISCILGDDFDYMPSPQIRSMSSFLICSRKVNNTCVTTKKIKKRSPKSVRRRSNCQINSKPSYSATESNKELNNNIIFKTEKSIDEFICTNNVDIQCESYKLNNYSNSGIQIVDSDQHEIIKKTDEFQKCPDLSNYVCMYADTQNMFINQKAADLGSSNAIEKKIDINISPSKVTCKNKKQKKNHSINGSPFKHRKRKIQRLDEKIVKPLVIRKSLRRLKILNDYLQKFRFERSLPLQTQSVFQLNEKQYMNTIFRVMQDYKYRHKRFINYEENRKKSKSEPNPNFESNETGHVQMKHISNPTKICFDPNYREKSDGMTSDELKLQDIKKNKTQKDINFVVNINIQTEKKNIKDRSVECVKILGDPKKELSASKYKDFAQLTSEDFMTYKPESGIKNPVSRFSKNECACKMCQDKRNNASTRAAEADKSISMPIIDSESFLRITDMTVATSFERESSEIAIINKNLIQTQTKISNNKIKSVNEQSRIETSLEFAPYAKFSEPNVVFKWKSNVKNETYMTVLQKPKFAFSESTVSELKTVENSVAKLSNTSVVSVPKPAPITNLPQATNILLSLIGHIYVIGVIFVFLVIVTAAAMYLIFHDNGNFVRSYYLKHQNSDSDNVVAPKPENSPYYQYSMNELGF